MSQNKNNDNKVFIEDIIDGMCDWVRVIDRNDNIVYVNKTMGEALKDCKKGKKCFEAVGREEPCENCISRKAVFDGQTHMKEEIINNRIFSVMSSPVKNSDGEIVAAVEVLRDITEIKSLQNKVLEQNKKLQDDLNIAKKLQCSLLPKDLPEEKIKFSFVYKPCEDLGGDFLDIFNIDEDHIGLYIADVSGHGVPASLLTVFLRSSIDKKGLSPSDVLTDLYKAFNDNDFDDEVYITVFYAIINLEDYSIRYSNAGHNVSPMVFNLNESERFELLRIPGIPISNWMINPGYSEKILNLEKGDRLFFSTDGILELKNKKREQFGENRLQKILINDRSEPNGTLNRIIASACEFAGMDDASKISDDITMVLIEMK